MATHKGSCYCGAVEIETTGDPIDMGFCHCDGCRKYSGAPMSAFTLWKPEQVKITKGENSPIQIPEQRHERPPLLQ